MPFPRLRHALHRLWGRDTLVNSLRVFIALAGAMLVGLWEQRLDLVIPLFLGIIASALAETDDNWLGRLQALLVTLACFAVAAFSVQQLFPYPWLFVIGLGLVTFALTMLGAAGARYATLGWSTLILAIYTMIGVEQRGGVPGSFWHEPLLLLAGAAWYGALSVLWAALFVNQPVQQSLARLFEELGLYLKIKSSLLEPVRQLDVEERRLELARQNGRVVSTLNQAKEILLHRFANGRPTARLNRYLQLYFIAQDIHERASSSHYPYNELAEAFFHSDVMFRCQRLLNQQGNACRTLGRAIRLREPFDHSESRAALDDLQTSLAHLYEQNRPEWRGLLRSLRALASNLETLDRKLSDASNPDALADQQDQSLLDRSPRTLREALQRIRLQLTPTSLVFRHALRLSIALCAGYGILHWIDPTQGYWILLTTLFVCQPNYGATRTRLVQRILGTLIGLVAGWALIGLFPQAILQAGLAVVAGVLFFATRTTRYTLATAAITLLVLLSFNQIGDGYGLIWPRLFDTLLGSLIAIAAVFLILPDWQGRRLDQLLAHPQCPRPVPARDPRPVRQRQARRPGLPGGAAQRPQRRRHAVHHPVQHAHGVGPFPQGRRAGLPFPGGDPHAARLPVRAGRAPRAAGRRRGSGRADRSRNPDCRHHGRNRCGTGGALTPGRAQRGRRGAGAHAGTDGHRG